ncbi:hypothetical protein L1049_004875 [Liquidambar formosana]|uniref:Uncharacterized protein n=1 Tax=Liquidambar formosana TaxID=63359 RepID=A0AAP0WYL3_LIQFO
MGMCEKIYNAITCGSASSISHQPEDPMPATSAQSLETPENSKAAGVVPVQFHPSILPPTPNEKEKSAIPYSSIQMNAQAPKVAPNIEPAPHPASATKPKAEMNEPAKTVVRQGHDQIAKVAPKMNNDEPPTVKGEKGKKFTDYTDHAKIKIRAPSNVGDGGKNGSSGHNINEKVSTYVNRAKLKFRSPSNVGGKSGSSGHNINEKVSDYVNRAKLKFRSPSNVGGGKSVSFK